MNKDIYHVRLIVTLWDSETIEANFSDIKKELYTYNIEKAKKLACEFLEKIVNGYYGNSEIDLDDQKEFYDSLILENEFQEAYQLVANCFDDKVLKIDNGHYGYAFDLRCELLRVED